MKQLIFNALRTLSKVGENLFNMNKILRFNPDPDKAAPNFNPVNLVMESTDLCPDALLEPGTYMIHCLIRLADGSIQPGTSTIRHISSENNEVVTSYIFSPDGTIPLQYYDENEDKLIIHEHKVLFDLNSEEFSTPFKNTSPHQGDDDHRIIIESVPECLIATDSLEPLSIEEQASFPYDLNYYFAQIGVSEYVLRVRKYEETGYKAKFGESPILYKFANGIQAVGMVYTSFNPCLPLFFSILHSGVMALLTDSNYRELLGVENIEELCPLKTFDIEYNEETEKVELREIFEIEKDDFLEMLNFHSSEFE